MRHAQREPGRLFRTAWSDGHVRRARGLVLKRPQPELPGVELSTYRTKGSSSERGNLQSSAGYGEPGKPPSPATSRRRGGASVVVRARESRAHGEGRQ